MFARDRFIEDCFEALRESNVEGAVKEIVSRAVSTPRSIEAELGVPSKAGLQVVHRSAELTILNVIWAPLMNLFPHDHQTWAVIGIYDGQEDNSFYRRREDGKGLDQINGRSLSEHDTVVLGDKVIHSVSNPRRQYTGALHVYGGDFFTIPRSEWDSPESAEQPYTVEHAMRAFDEANERAKALLAAQP